MLNYISYLLYQYISTLIVFKFIIFNLFFKYKLIISLTFYDISMIFQSMRRKEKERENYFNYI